MKNKKKKQPRKPEPRGRRFSVTTLTAATAVVLLAATIVVSRQMMHRESTHVKSAANAAKAEPGNKYVTVKVAGRDVQVDPQTGQVKPLSPEEAKKLAEGLKTMLNKSTDGLVQIQNLDGSVSMDLQGRFQNVVVARVNADGTLEHSCIDEPRAAAQFFGIDPQLLGVEQAKDTASQPVVRTPARKVNQ